LPTCARLIAKARGPDSARLKSNAAEKFGHKFPGCELAAVRHLLRANCGRGNLTGEGDRAPEFALACSRTIEAMPCK
jgi:hypothetical protein